MIWNFGEMSGVNGRSVTPLGACSGVRLYSILVRCFLMQPNSSWEFILNMYMDPLKKADSLTIDLGFFIHSFRQL